MIHYLIDTNVISELSKPAVRPGIAEWFAKTPYHSMRLSTLTLAEIHHGIHNPRISPARKQALQYWFDESLMPAFARHIVPFDGKCAAFWGEMIASIKRTMGVIDTLIAATALAHNLTLVTRNLKDFDIAGLKVIDPWNPE